MPTLKWIGKDAVEHHHQEVPYRLVHCDGELSAGDPDAGNLLVQGDNLEALKALLPYYAGQVKCIYIDPPYNTGNEGWVYNDNVNSPEIRSWLGKVVGKEAEDLSRHDKWLCMMYPRLRLLRDFLREDGVIFVSIDENEASYLHIAMEEIFGRSNYIATIAWQRRLSPDDRLSFSHAHDNIIVFARNAKEATFNRFPLTEAQRSKFKNPDNDPRGPWVSTDFTAQGWRPNQMYEIISPAGVSFTPPQGRCWGNTEPRLQEFLWEGRMYFGRDGKSRPRIKTYLHEREGTRAWTWWPNEESGNNQEARKELLEVFGGDAGFDTPKPLRLISRIIQIGSGKDDIILDSFAGSATTGHAVLALNQKDGGTRRFILAEMDESVATKVSSERLRRVIQGFDKNGDTNKTICGLGGGFRFCRLGVPLFNEFGDIDTAVSFPDLAAHIFFAETGAPIPAKATGNTPYLGKHAKKAVYLLFSPGQEGIAREAAGNVLTPDALANLPAPPEGFDGLRIVYAEGTTVSPDRLKSEGVVFKQIPYQIAGV